ncbi:polysaccharide deacetylase family protein [Polynucleobacter kasalickyi]|uniref:Peptidoglycan/xylan/chitin deacetylase, PgdA/CDA1 family n=1 Tax=Polynucleobacter kasalickyi TaxID=1938817 RepID=A0A1W1Y748_9BURK|nr:polysaccharide deacetylase family protein [Polynucleobacter kasalickyi]SMC31969.1 Peptidoglycan/xylan/chitin deacetylase, PgdA/CDA1 family [Polynucleobacter kasalickyi]
MARIALKVDVDTLRGTQEGVPRLQQLLDECRIQATFLFSLGFDHTGWALKNIFRPGFFQKVSRTSVIEHYGLKTLSYGVLLPAPDIGVKARAEMRSVASSGHEVGIHTWDHRVWQDYVRDATPEWTLRQMNCAWDRFGEIFQTTPQTHGAAGWQMNATALAHLDTWQIKYSSDGRAPLNLVPYRVKLDGLKTCEHIQYPTTLPTLDELIGVDDMTGEEVIAHLLTLTANNPNDQVFTLHAELEGQKFLPLFKQLLIGWMSQGHDLVSMQELHLSWQKTGQLRHLAELPFTWGEIPNRSGELMRMPDEYAI